MSLAKEIYEQFQRDTRQGSGRISGGPDFNEIPEMYRTAWENVVKTVTERAASVVRESAPEAAKAVEALAA